MAQWIEYKGQFINLDQATHIKIFKNDSREKYEVRISHHQIDSIENDRGTVRRSVFPEVTFLGVFDSEEEALQLGRDVIGGKYNVSFIPSFLEDPAS